MLFRRIVPLTIAAGLVLAIAGAWAAVAPAAGPSICSGKLGTPGLLKGTYPHGVVVKGACAVKSGKARVIGTLTVTKGSALAAAYGRHHASLSVTGDLVVGNGATVILGCKANPDGSGFPCLDDPNMKHPTLTSHATVTGNLIENSPLAVIAHNSAIGGNVKETGGGGSVSCAPPTSGVFAKIMSPVYSDYEDSTVGGNMRISAMSSCWLGIARVKIHGSLSLSNNQMGDPDAIEVLSSHVGKNLSCVGNGHPSPMPPGTQPVWDSVDTGPMGSIYPRAPQPNTVGGTRSGQCVSASPPTQGGPPGTGAF
ncbi:MAG TPA: hypothetical protein VMP89_04020 [Solirubrobacteraceae bacterium]|nr:hypothetical protein [Solirubrobacteraceae bacterium]